DGFFKSTNFTIFIQLLPFAVMVRLPCFVFLGLYRTLIRFLSLHDMIAIFKSATASSVLLVSLTFFLNFRSLSRMVFLIDWLFVMFLMSALRVALKLHSDRKVHKKRVKAPIRILIYGAG